MSLAVLHSRTLVGIHTIPVRVEAFLSSGLPAFHIVGLPDSEVRESRERVRGALICSGYAFPAGRLTVNLSPADIPKETGRLDLPIALGILLASGQLGVPEDGIVGTVSPTAAPRLKDCILLGELSLSGALMSCRGALPIAVNVFRQSPGSHVFMPFSSALQASCVTQLSIYGAKTLREVADHLCGIKPIPRTRRSVSHETEALLTHPCMSDVKGQSSAKLAIEIAAAGRHSLLMQGSPGVGKTMLAQRLPGILPALSEEERLDVMMVQSFQHQDTHAVHRPFRSPHHSSSVAALIGGGKQLSLGEVSLAHKGVLFLDELPEFNRQALESLREPLETGTVQIARAAYRAELPADFQLVAAMNPCPCGWFGHPDARCRCSAESINRYLGKLSGPLLDRIDMVVRLFSSDDDRSDDTPRESSQVLLERVIRAREIQIRRQGCLNAQLVESEISVHCRLSSQAHRRLRSVCQAFGLSNRALSRIIRLARTLSDLSGEDHLTEASIAQAMQVRQEIKKPL